jgi:FAD/FMN-containing dehydrogenase
MEFVKKNKGSISAEHGVGQQKTSFLNYTKSKPMIEMMQKIKEVFDPNMILNPYKVLPSN